MGFERSRHRYKPNSKNMQNKNEIINIIKNKSKSILKMENPKEFVELAQKFGKTLVNDRVTSSQLRKFFCDVKRLDDDFNNAKANLQMLRPKLAYAKGKKPELTNFQMVLENLIVSISSNVELRGFKEFFEALIAYHKAEGGKD